MKSTTITATVHAPIEHVWKAWNDPKHVTKWNHASDDWECPHGTNDLRVGGKFNYRMQAKDGSFGFDFGGTYTKVEHHKLIEYVMDDHRKVSVHFEPHGNDVKITSTFDLESQNSEEMQRGGWQAILDNFKKYAEHTK
jgi:uncharacterized protein YndB with AHSA1/START domain